MSNPENQQDYRAERDLARDFIRHVLVPESENSPTLKFFDDWEEKAESFIMEAKGEHDEETTTALLAILVNVSKALVDQVNENPSSPVRNVAQPLFAYIRVLALKHSPTLQEAVEEKRRDREEARVKLASEWEVNVPNKAIPPTDSGHGGRKSLLDVMISRKKGSN